MGETMIVNNRLAEIISDLGETQYGLAKTTGLSQPYINKIINGHKTPTIETLEKLCKALGITLAEFFDESPQAVIPLHIQRLIHSCEGLAPEQVESIIAMVEQMKK